MIAGVSATHVLVFLLGVLVISVVSVAVIRIALAPMGAKLDRVISLLEARGEAPGA